MYALKIIKIFLFLHLIIVFIQIYIIYFYGDPFDYITSDLITSF
jgi:hypothetical protein